MYTHLIESGAHFSRPLTASYGEFNYGGSHFSREVKQPSAFEEQIEACDINYLMVSILRREERNFLRALTPSNLHHASRVNGLTPLHFAIDWPSALEQLIAAGADVNCEDSFGLRPIHLAVACRQASEVGILLRADCSMYTPAYSNSLLRESLCQGSCFNYVSDWIVDALIDRHARLINLAISLLPGNSELRRGLNLSTIVEARAPVIFDALTKSGVPIPPSLKLDGDSVYDTLNYYTPLTVSLAEKLWQAGFQQVYGFTSPTGLSPLLQSWSMADFKMGPWFIGKGVSPFSRDRKRSLTSLHFFAARLACPEGFFGFDAQTVPTSPHHIEQLAGKSVWHSSCRFLCSVGGCTPISTVVSHSWDRIVKYDTYQYMAKHLEVWQEKMVYQPEKYPDHAKQLLRAILFEKMRLLHTCSRIE